MSKEERALYPSVSRKDLRSKTWELSWIPKVRSSSAAYKSNTIQFLSYNIWTQSHHRCPCVTLQWFTNASWIKKDASVFLLEPLLKTGSSKIYRTRQSCGSSCRRATEISLICGGIGGARRTVLKQRCRSRHGQTAAGRAVSVVGVDRKGK